MIELGVNIDHVATIRQARRTWEPDPLEAAVEAQLGGADGITLHLREDRRHIQDDDVRRIRTELQVKLNFEMAATDEMVAFACEIMPEMAMLVPEGREEITTEGGLDVLGASRHVEETVSRLRDAGILVSVFIDPDLSQVEAAAACGLQVCEVHTGPYAHAFHEHEGDLAHPELLEALAAVAQTGKAIEAAGMKFNAGHALNYQNVQPIAGLPNVRELHIGHSIVSRAVFVGLREAVREMSCLIQEASAAGGSIPEEN
jgi:pyridoxine 5-phosphate synthase